MGLDDQATPKLEGFSANLDNVGGSLVSFGTKVVAAGALAVGAIAGIGTGLLAIGEDIAPLADITSAFDRLATTSGETSAEVLANLQKLSSGLIDEGDLMKDYNLSIQMMGKSLTDQFTSAIPMIQQLALSTGADMGQMISSFEEGIGRMRPMALAQMGLVFDTSQVYDTYAKSIGKTASELTAQERQTALMTAAMEQLRQKTAGMAPAGDSAQASFMRMNVSLQNLKEGIELAILPLAQKLADAITAFIPKIQIWIGQVQAWLNVGVLYFEYYFGLIKEKIDTFLGGPIDALIADFRDGDFSTLPTILKKLFDGIVALFWDSLATPIGKALGSIPKDWQAPIVIGIGLIALAFTVAAIPKLITNITTAIGILTGVSMPILVVVIAGVVLGLIAWQTNFLGVRDTAQALAKALPGVAQTIRSTILAVIGEVNNALQTAISNLQYLTSGGATGTLSGGTYVTPGTGGGVSVGTTTNATGFNIGGQSSGAVIGGFTIGGKASGGPVMSGTPYIVGEQGPELFVPGTDGHIQPNGFGDIHITVTEGNAYKAGQNFGQGLMERLHSRGLQS